MIIHSKHALNLCILSLQHQCDKSKVTGRHKKLDATKVTAFNVYCVQWNTFHANVCIKKHQQTIYLVTSFL